ncbi:hypothetical protein D3C81_1083530 [compost metagenome]
MQPTLMGCLDQFFQLGIAAEVRVHVEEVAGEVAGGIQPIVPGLTGTGVEHRGQPDGVDVEALDVVQAVDDPLQIAVVPGRTVADTVVGTAVAIDEGLHHHLIGAQVAGGLIIAVAGAAVRGGGRIDHGGLGFAAGAPAAAAARCQ